MASLVRAQRLMQTSGLMGAELIQYSGSVDGFVDIKLYISML